MTNRIRSIKPLLERSPFAKSLRIFFWIVPITGIKGRVMKTELFAFLRSEITGLALNTDNQNCSSEPLL